MPDEHVDFYPHPPIIDADARPFQTLVQPQPSGAPPARRELEKKSGRKVVSSENYLALTQSTKKVQNLANPTGKKRVP